MNLKKLLFIVLIFVTSSCGKDITNQKKQYLDKVKSIIASKQYCQLADMLDYPSDYTREEVANEKFILCKMFDELFSSYLGAVKVKSRVEKVTGIFLNIKISAGTFDSNKVQNVEKIIYLAEFDNAGQGMLALNLIQGKLTFSIKDITIYIYKNASNERIISRYQKYILDKIKEMQDKEKI